MNQVLDRFLNCYQGLNATNLEQLHDIYADDVLFIDPVHQIQGLDDLTAYFQRLYQHISFIHFDYHERICLESQASIYWTMTYAHPKLNRGEQVSVLGNTHVKCHPKESARAGQVYYHRDYFDMGDMLYEALPLLGLVIRRIKKRMGA